MRQRSYAYSDDDSRERDERRRTLLLPAASSLLVFEGEDSGVLDERSVAGLVGASPSVGLSAALRVARILFDSSLRD